jgi:hypothetical protein
MSLPALDVTANRIMEICGEFLTEMRGKEVAERIVILCDQLEHRSELVLRERRRMGVLMLDAG